MYKRQGIYYDKGIGVEQDNTQAFHYFKLAADQGLTQAREAISEYYREGIGVDKDADMARHYHQLAQSQNVQEDTSDDLKPKQGVVRSLIDQFKLWLKLN